MSAGGVVETKISYKLDPRGLREARQELEKTFKPASAKELNASLKEMRGMMRALAGESARLNGELMKAQKGTDAFKKLENQLKDVDSQMRRVSTSATALGQAVRDAGVGSFSQGLMQGLSPTGAGFLERGPGMRRQFIGQQIGSGVRGGFSRAVGAGSSMMGGAGPLSTMFGNIPFIGGAASAAESAAGMAVDYQRARLAASPFLQLGMRNVDVFGDVPNTGRSSRRGRRRGLVGSAGGISGQLPDGPGSSIGFGDIAGAIANPWGYGGKGGIPDIISKVMSDKQAQGIFEQSVTGTGASGSTRKKIGSRSALDSSPFDAIEAIGRRAMMTRQESLAAFSELAGVAGGTPSMGAFKGVEAARLNFGIDRGVSGGLLRGQRAGGGGSTALGEGMLANTIADALEQGLEGSEISDYLSTIASMQEQAAQRGVKIQTETMTGLGVALARGMGLEGSRGGAVAAQFANAAGGVTDQGARGPVDIQFLRAAGFDPSKGKSSFFGAMKKLESAKDGGFDADTLFNLVRNLTDGATGEEAGFTLKRALSSKGINVGFGEAERMAGAVAGGRQGFVSRLGPDLAQLGADGRIQINSGATRGVTADSLTKGLDTDVFKSLTGTIRAQNAIQDKMLAAGQETIGTVQAMQSTAADLAKKIGELEPLMQPLVSGVKAAGAALGRVVDKVNEFAANGAIPVEIVK